MTVLDLSNYDYSVDKANPGWAQCLKDNGVTGVILGVQDLAIARIQANELSRAHIPIIALYGFDYFTAGAATGNGDINDACMLAGELGGIHRVYIDCEIDNTPDTVEDRNDEVRECIRTIESYHFEAGIYTAPWWWVPNHGNTSEFKDHPLWFSNYGANDGQLPAIEELGVLSFGGWTRCVVHQYTSRLEICGRGRDANYVFEEEDDVTAQEQIAELNAAMVKREQIRRIASDPDLPTVEKAHAALVTAGLIV